MNHLIFFDHQKNTPQESENLYRVSDPSEIEHLQKVIKLKENQILKAILINRGPCKATYLFEEIKGGAKELLFKLDDFESPEERTIDLLIGLSRPQAIKKILEYCSGHPIKKIIFYPAELSEKSYATSKVLEKENLQKLLIAGLSQCGRFSCLPDVSVLTRVSQDLISNYENKYILSLDSSKSLKSISLKKQNSIFALGPERGYTNKELEKFKEWNFQDILLSKSILRVETAIIALCSQLELLEIE